MSFPHMHTIHHPSLNFAVIQEFYSCGKKIVLVLSFPFISFLVQTKKEKRKKEKKKDRKEESLWTVSPHLYYL